MVSQHYCLKHLSLCKRSLPLTRHKDLLLPNKKWMLPQFPMKIATLKMWVGKLDERSYCMLPLPSPSIYMIMLCQPMPVLQYCFFPHLLRFYNTTGYKQQVFMPSSFSYSSDLVCVIVTHLPLLLHKLQKYTAPSTRLY
jgi:hypothetical protein